MSDSDLAWRTTPPGIPDLAGHGEQYFWVRGGNLNRPIVVRANAGVNTQLVDGKRKHFPEVNFEFSGLPYPGHIWASDLHRWPGLSGLEWAGPLPRPPD